MESSGQLKAGQAGNENAGLVTFLHVLMVVAIIALIVGFIVIKA